MKQYFKTKVDRNGNQFQLVVDHSERTFSKGYCLFSIFTPCNPVTTTRKCINEQAQELRATGYKEI